MSNRSTPLDHACRASRGSKIDCRYLHSFVAVAECRSFSEAARRLHIAQPALSRQVRLLEYSVRSTLFIRSVKGVSLSEAGERLLPHARSILDQIGELPDIVSLQNNDISGRVCVGIPTSASAVLSKPLLDVVRDALPNVQLHLVESMSGFLMEWLRSGNLDFSILYDPEPNAHIEFEPLLIEELALIGSADSLAGVTEARFSELARYPLVLPSPSHSLRRVLETIAARNRSRLNVVIEIDSLSILKEEIIGGEYFSVLSPSAVRNEVRSGVLRNVRLIDPCVSRTVTLARSSAKPQTRASREVAKLAAEVAHQLRERGLWASAPSPQPVAAM
jgi:LysR family transcriptional regulator, nitrogen assimilation regulatory protein